MAAMGMVAGGRSAGTSRRACVSSKHVRVISVGSGRRARSVVGMAEATTSVPAGEGTWQVRSSETLCPQRPLSLLAFDQR